MIEPVEMFRTKGSLFNSLEKAIEYREGLVERFLRKLPGFDTMAAKHRIAFVQEILDKRNELRDLLDFGEPQSD